MDPKLEQPFVEEVRMLADEVDERLERLSNDFGDGTKPGRPMLPKMQRVYDIYSGANRRATAAAEGRTERPRSGLQERVLGYANKLCDDVNYSDNPSGYVGEIEDTHRALLCIGFKPDHQIILRLQEVYHDAYRAL